MNKCFANIYKQYCDNKNLITITSCFELLKDFEVFPKEISLVKIKEIFILTNKLYLDSEDFINKDSEWKKSIKYELSEILDYKRFINLICIISIYLYSNRLDKNIHKVLYLMRKMSISKGQNIIQSKKALCL